MKNIILCADDYGQNESISQAIIHLAEKDRLSATSCLTNSVDWLASAKKLLPLKHKIDVGLHINFTDGQPLSSAFQKRYGAMFSLPILLAKALTHRLDQAAFAAELNAQLDYFVEGMGCLPDFIDGHQHVHHFPIIRAAVLSVYAQRLKNQGVYIRSVTAKPNTLKKLIIQVSGARAFKKMLLAQQIPHNVAFSGIYAFKEAVNYAQLFPLFLEETPNQGLIMCHPGGIQAGIADPIQLARVQEFNYFASEAFLQDCAKARVSVVRGR